MPAVGRIFSPLPWARSLFGSPLGRLQHLQLLRRISNRLSVRSPQARHGGPQHHLRMVPWLSGLLLAYIRDAGVSDFNVTHAREPSSVSGAPGS